MKSIEKRVIDIVSILRKQGSDSVQVEAKTAAGSKLPKDFWRTVSAFANSAAGGQIILGLSEEK